MRSLMDLLEESKDLDSSSQQSFLHKCDHNVKIMKISEICKSICSGGTPNSGISSYYNGDIPWLRTQEIDWNDIYDTSVKITNDGYDNSSAKWIKENCVIVAMYGATAAKVAINKIPLTTNQACCNLEINNKIANFKFVYYWLCKEYTNLKSLGQGSQSNINANIIKNYPIAIPPLPVQQEIVRILDNFTELEAELEAELGAELEERKKQYSYFRDSLLNFDRKGNPFPCMSIGDFANFTYGYTERAKDKGTARFIRITDITDSGCLSPDNVKFIDICDENKKYLLKKGDILMARTGATYGRTLYISEDFPAIYASFLIKISPHNNKMLNRFYWHFAQSSVYWKQANNLVSKGGQPQFNSNVLCKVMVPVPPLSEQQRIVDILDKFDALCNDLTSDLSAEIAARRKQYEYYRDKLLTFKEKSHE